MMHWATEYIGKPYLRTAEGPDSYDCWGLARTIFRTRMGLDMPQVAVGQATNLAAMREIACGFGWGKVDDAPQEYDALLMQSMFGRHIAVAIRANNKMVFIHADERAGVEVLPSLQMFRQLGYSNLEVWRYASRK